MKQDVMKRDTWHKGFVIREFSVLCILLCLSAMPLQARTVLPLHSGEALLCRAVKDLPSEDTTVRYAFSPVRHSGLYSPLPEELPAGQYSGIAYMGGTRYAVVHDRLSGGGLVLLDISIADDGSVTYVSSSVPEATSGSAISGLDNEDVAFIPSVFPRSKIGASSDVLNTAREFVPGTLYICSEKEQTISEYTLDGYPTGRSLEVPELFAKGRIRSNNGFEALTYNVVTGRFWTTTERPLVADEDQAFRDSLDARGPVLRLQSFSYNLSGAESFFYEMDLPSKTDAEAKAARAYVHGVSAIAALDDGSLLVLEREVFVPNGGTLAMMLGAFSRIKIYRVEPKGEAGGRILEKNLFVSFITASLNLANFEGMCIGPDLPGGWHTLVMIADSQGGQGGKIAEYIKVITFK